MRYLLLTLLALALGFGLGYYTHRVASLFAMQAERAHAEQVISEFAASEYACREGR